MAVAHSMPNLSAVIRARREAGGVTEIILTGACNWSVNYGVSDQWTWPDCDAVLPGLDEAGVAAYAERIYGCSLKSKSRYLHCEIAVHYWSESRASTASTSTGRKVRQAPPHTARRRAGAGI